MRKFTLVSVLVGLFVFGFCSCPIMAQEKKVESSWSVTMGLGASIPARKDFDKIAEPGFYRVFQAEYIVQRRSDGTPQMALFGNYDHSSFGAPIVDDEYKAVTFGGGVILFFDVIPSLKNARTLIKIGGSNISNGTGIAGTGIEAAMGFAVQVHWGGDANIRFGLDFKGLGETEAVVDSKGVVVEESYRIAEFLPYVGLNFRFNSLW